MEFKICDCSDLVELLWIQIAKKEKINETNQEQYIEKLWQMVELENSKPIDR